ncbi:hypothetical protein F5Y18DRAFT_294762 [Xylariaceae sp. FL1019]|nr:hypothetical protein F5Y18DRAFT_294762 [Xylariaceae sp. FL1019]
MNQIRSIQALNKREIEAGITPEASWHTDYRDTAFINFGGLPYNLTEGDILTIFSQYGEPVFLKLARDQESGKSKGFGWLKYEDQRSCDLAVDNLGGADIAGRLVRVDHARYKARDDEDPAQFDVSWKNLSAKEGKGGIDTEGEESEEEQRPMIREEIELQKLIGDHDDDDPMKGFLIEEKKREIQEALRKDRGEKEKKERRHRHHHKSHHRSRRDEEEDKDGHRSRRSRRDETPVARGNGGDRDDTLERRRDGSRDRERERRRRHDDERRSDGDGRRDRDRNGERDRGGEARRSRRHEDGERERDRDHRDRRERRRSRSRSSRPRSYRD